LKHFFSILILLCSLGLNAQRDTLPYDRKEEIIVDQKRYAFHNNYVTFGGGFAGSNLRDREQSTLAADFVFHIQRHHFQIGFLMSGDAFLNNNNLSGHLAYCYRIEDERRNIAFSGGLAQNKGQIAAHIGKNGDTIPIFFYRNPGIYLSASYIRKLTYDIGIGGEFFTELNQVQQMVGLKAVVFFSGAYRGKPKLYNRHVRRRHA
jgi:hypothetical protein